MLNQRFGIELEYNSFSENQDENKLPLGILEAANILIESINKNVYVSNWHTTVGNDYWILKPDSSCGFEICSPILKNNKNLIEIKKIIKAIRKKGIFLSDKRCSYHIHFELNNTTNNFLSNLIISWVRLELFFFSLLPNLRKQTNYAQMLSLSPLFFFNKEQGLDSFIINQDMVVNYIKDYKFYSINLYHFKKSNRNTIEFRIMDSSACLNEEYAYYWILLFNKFMEVCNNINYFNNGILDLNYVKWLSTEEAFDFLKISKDSKIFNFCKSRFYNYSLDTNDLKMSVFKNIFECFTEQTKKYFEK